MEKLSMYAENFSVYVEGFSIYTEKFSIEIIFQTWEESFVWFGLLV